MAGSNGIILIADDDAAVLMLVAGIARRLGYDVLMARDGNEALDMSRRYRGRIDLVISDIEMPGRNGVDLAAAVLKERPCIKVLLVSGSTELTIPVEFRFLRKPFTIAAMRQAIADLLAVMR